MNALSATNKRHEPLSLDPLDKRLCETFPYLWQPIIGVNETDPQWQTITKYPMRPRVLWKHWQDAAQIVGVRFCAETGYALIDIDRESPYHPKEDPNALQTMRAALETIGIYRTVLIRSSWSEGLHLYIPLLETVPTFGLACALKQCLEAQGFAIAQGTLEIFPNCKTYAKPGTYIEDNAHRLPLQPASGSCLLDDDGNPISRDLRRFFEGWDTAAAGQDLAELRQAISTARTNRKAKTRRSDVVEDWQRDLLSEMEDGWTGHGQTNHLLKTIACYGVVFEELKGDALAAYVERTAIASPGYAQWCRHQPDIKMRSTVWARAAEGYYWQLGDPPKRSGSFGETPSNNVVPFNLARSEDAQSRIKEAVRLLEAQGTLPATATARANAIAEQGVSLKTLYRHRELWHPLHDQGTSNDQSKIAQLEAAPAIFESDRANIPESPKPSDSKEFYTSEKSMKGEGFESGLPFFSTFHKQQTALRSTLTESGTLNQPFSPLERLLIGESEKETVTANSFPQPSISPDRDGSPMPEPGVRYSENDDPSRSRGG